MSCVRHQRSCARVCRWRHQRLCALWVPPQRGKNEANQSIQSYPPQQESELEDSDHESLMAVVLLVTDTRAVTVRCMATNGRAWAGEQELCMVCSVMSAALACVTLVLAL